MVGFLTLPHPDGWRGFSWCDERKGSWVGSLLRMRRWCYSSWCDEREGARVESLLRVHVRSVVGRGFSCFRATGIFFARASRFCVHRSFRFLCVPFRPHPDGWRYFTWCDKRGHRGNRSLATPGVPLIVNYSSFSPKLSLRAMCLHLLPQAGELARRIVHASARRSAFDHGKENLLLLLLLLQLLNYTYYYYYYYYYITTTTTTTITTTTMSLRFIETV